MLSERDRPASRITRWALLFEGGLGAAAMAISWLLGRPLWAAAPTPRGAAIAAVWGAAAAGPLLAGLWLVETSPWAVLARLRRLLRRRVAPLLADASLGQLALISLAAGVGEEMLFRGVLQSAIADAAGGPWGPWIGLGAASVLFGLCHWLSAAYAAVAALVGLYLGALYLAAGQQLAAPVAAHALYDFLALAHLTRQKGDQERPMSSGE